MAKQIPTPAEIDEEVNRLLAGHLFWEYCLYYDFEFFTKRPFLKEIADVLQFVYDEYIDGRSCRISASMPPRSGKSYITSLYCAWWLGKLPKHAVMRNSCTARLYNKFSYDVRNVVRSARHQRVFPEAILSGDKQNLDGWNLSTAKQVSYFGAGVGGTIIGFGANLAISDDLYRGLEDAMSPVYNEKVATWKESAHDSRKERNCPELFIGTRWSQGDVIGQAQEKKRIHRIVNIKALDENQKSFCEDVKTTEEYREMKADMDEAIWEAEYQQNPIELKGLMFPKSQLNYYNPADMDLDKVSDFRFGYIDPADEGADRLAFPGTRLVGNKIYVHKVIFNSDGTDINGPNAVEFILSDRMNAVEIESNSAWILFRKAIKKSIEETGSDCDIRSINSTSNKHTRILEASAFIRNHFVFRSDWETCDKQYRDFMKEVFTYMKSQTGAKKNPHEDAPDSLTGAARYYRKNFAHLWRVTVNGA